MFRNWILGFALLLTAVGVWLLLQHGWVPGIQILVIGLLVTLGTLFENWRYRKAPPPVAARWQPTQEKFADPISGEEMQVLYDPASGERRYVRADQPAG